MMNPHVSQTSSPEPAQVARDVAHEAGSPELSPAAPEEALVVDARAQMGPAQFVERKLLSLLKSRPLPVSHLNLTWAARLRGQC